MKDNFRVRYPNCRIKHKMKLKDEYCVICMEKFTENKLKVNFKNGCNHVYFIMNVLENGR